MTEPVYAIGDIHGQAEELDRVCALIERDGGADARVIFLGDYTDRGPDSRGVVERLIAGRDEGRPWTVLMGNHDRLFARFVDEGALRDPRMPTKYTWLHPSIGGGRTLASYGVEVPGDAELEAVSADAARAETIRRAAADAVPEGHVAFLAGLDAMHVTADQVFVHAGIRPGLPLEAQDVEDLLWIRDAFLGDLRDHGRLVVHGHTQIPVARHHGNRLNLDGGAGFGRPLTAARIEGRRAWILTDDGGREALPPDP